MTNIRYVFLLFTTLLALSCANQSSPTGGPKDEDPPLLESSIPEDQQLNFGGDKIELEFNEFINIDNLKEQLIITPRLNQEYNAKYKKNKVTLKFDQPLDSNTTYTFQFREGIKDLNEGNVPQNLMLAFSTGTFMDSLSISGTVISLLTQQPANDVIVSLYQSEDTLDIYNSSPLYLAKTNKDGLFIINNIKHDTYKIFSVADKNRNLKLEPSDEKYAFYTEVIKLDSSMADIKLDLIGLDTNPMELQNARTSGHYFVVKYNKFITNYRIKANTADSIYTTIDSEGKEIKFYNTFPIADSLMLTINAMDSLNSEVEDTIYLKFEETKRDKDKYDINITSKDIKPESPSIEITVNFSKPSEIGIPDSLYIAIDSLNKITFDSTNFTWNKYFSQLIINKNIDKSTLIIPDSLVTKIKTSLNLYAGELAFKSIEQDSSKALQKKISVIDSKNVGLIKVEIKTQQTSYLVQLLKSNYEIVEEVKDVKTYSFDNLKPGDYRIRVLLDSNNDGKWQQGNITTNTPSEPVLFYSTSDGKQVLTLRANWELGPNVISF